MCKICQRLLYKYIQLKGGIFIFLNSTCQNIGKELLAMQDDFLTVMINNKEYAIKAIKRIKTHANQDDGVMHTSLICDELSGNIVR